MLVCLFMTARRHPIWLASHSRPSRRAIFHRAQSCSRNSTTTKQSARNSVFPRVPFSSADEAGAKRKVSRPNAHVPYTLTPRLGCWMPTALQKSVRANNHTKQTSCCQVCICSVTEPASGEQQLWHSSETYSIERERHLQNAKSKEWHSFTDCNSQVCDETGAHPLPVTLQHTMLWTPVWPPVNLQN